MHNRSLDRTSGEKTPNVPRHNRRRPVERPALPVVSTHEAIVSQSSRTDSPARMDKLSRESASISGKRLSRQKNGYTSFACLLLYSAGSLQKTSNYVNSYHKISIKSMSCLCCAAGCIIEEHGSLRRPIPLRQLHRSSRAGISPLWQGLSSALHPSSRTLSVSWLKFARR
ncbi:hypothetical protein FHT86_007700 [Rhizobium sp. BK313]|nr:hypothetical protein [Rhizobium sp. BK313]